MVPAEDLRLDLTWPPQSTLATVERLAHLTRSYLHAALPLADIEEAEDVNGRQPPSAAEEARTARTALAEVVEALGVYDYLEAGDAAGGLGPGIRSRWTRAHAQWRPGFGFRLGADDQIRCPRGCLHRNLTLTDAQRHRPLHFGSSLSPAG